MNNVLLIINCVQALEHLALGLFLCPFLLEVLYVACAITDTAYISHHSAFKYYGLANQVFYEVYVSSEIKFNHFEYGHVTYKYVASRMKEGIVEAKNTTGVRITDLERTVIDSIKDFNKIGGLEELLYCLESIHYLDENKLRRSLDIYNIQGLYQKQVIF